MKKLSNIALALGLAVMAILTFHFIVPLAVASILYFMITSTTKEPQDDTTNNTTEGDDTT